MSENPYASSHEVLSERSRVFSFGKMFWLGFAIVLVSFFCFCFFFNQGFLAPMKVGDSATELSPSGLAGQISVAMGNLAVTVFTGFAGLVVLVIGLFQRRKSS